MRTETNCEPFAAVRLRTAALPSAARLPLWREVFAQGMLQVDLEPLEEAPFEVDAVLRALPGVRTLSCTSSPFHMRRTQQIVARSNDDFGLVVNLGRKARVSQLGREVELRPGEAAPITNTERASFMHAGSRHVGIIAPRAALAPLARHLEPAAARVIPRSNEALRLLVGYVRALHAEALSLAPPLAHLTARHVHELFALAIGPTREGAALAAPGGLRAARLHAMQSYIAAHAGAAGLSVVQIARRHAVTPRYVQMLFHEEGTTFTQFVEGERLSRACLLLSDARYAHLTIGAIAFEAGFGDLSHFNRRFRRRYGTTPSDFRRTASAAG